MGPVGLGHDGQWTQRAWDVMGSGHSGPGMWQAVDTAALGHDGQWTKRDCNMMGSGHSGPGTQQADPDQQTSRQQILW